MRQSILVTKTIGINIREFDNFYVISSQTDRILLKKHAVALDIKIWEMSYDELCELKFPSYQVKDKQNITAIADWEVERWNCGVAAKNDSH
jgi:hypothetical protein